MDKDYSISIQVHGPLKRDKHSKYFTGSTMDLVLRELERFTHDLRTAQNSKKTVENRPRWRP